MNPSDRHQDIPLPAADNTFHRLGKSAEMNGNSHSRIQKELCGFPLPAYPENIFVAVVNLHIGGEQPFRQPFRNIARYLNGNRTSFPFPRRTTAENTVFSIFPHFFSAFMTVFFTHNSLQMV